MNKQKKLTKNNYVRLKPTISKLIKKLREISD
jgi:hypothetical protein